MTCAIIISAAAKKALLNNGRAGIDHAEGTDHDPAPVVRLFIPGTAAVWLLTEIRPQDPDLAFGLCDLGLGCPELGYVSLAELSTLRIAGPLPVTADATFIASAALSAYATAAQASGQIVHPLSAGQEQPLTLAPTTITAADLPAKDVL